MEIKRKPKKNKEKKMGIIDLHSHVIPEIDDGSHTFEESYEIFTEAVDAGISKIISTSHYLENSYEEEEKNRKLWITQMNDVLKQKKIAIELLIGSEIYVTPNIVKLIREEKASTLADSKYVLFELPMHNKIMYLEEVIFSLQSAGFIPIIAHPERYSYVQKDPIILEELIEKGVLFQANYASCIGYYGRSAKTTLAKLLKANYITFLGSDVHHKGTIYPQMNKIRRELEKIIKFECIEDLMCKNAERVIYNENIPTNEIGKIKKWFF